MHNLIDFLLTININNLMEFVFLFNIAIINIVILVVCLIIIITPFM